MFLDPVNAMTGMGAAALGKAPMIGGMLAARNPLIRDAAQRGLLKAGVDWQAMGLNRLPGFLGRQIGNAMQRFRGAGPASPFPQATPPPPPMGRPGPGSGALPNKISAELVSPRNIGGSSREEEFRRAIEESAEFGPLRDAFRRLDEKIARRSGTPPWSGADMPHPSSFRFNIGESMRKADQGVIDDLLKGGQKVIPNPPKPRIRYGPSGIEDITP